MLLGKPTSSKIPNEENTEDTSLLSRWNKNHLNFKVEKLILDPWASGTKKQYKIYFKQKTTFCKTQTVDFSNASIKDGTKFLLWLYIKGTWILRN